MQDARFELTKFLFKERFLKLTSLANRKYHRLSELQSVLDLATVALYHNFTYLDLPSYPRKDYLFLRLEVI